MGNNRFRRCCAVAFALVAALGLSRRTSAAPAVEALVIGANHSFVADQTSVGTRLAPLRYADDDAAAFYEFMRGIADGVQLLTLMDAQTQALHPKLVSLARVPTMAELESAIESLRSRLQRHREERRRTALYVFFSGHGYVSGSRRPMLSLLDGGIDQTFLYEKILERLPADSVHLFVDACHAEAVVRPRDLEAAPVAVTLEDARALVGNTTLARFPHVGSIIASASNAQAHEWDAIGHGIFTHELLSALRGAADVNGDRRLEYSEVYAFMAAANRSIDDPRARLALLARAPESDRRAVIVSLTEFSKSGTAWLEQMPGGSGLIQVEHESGRPVASFRAETGSRTDLLVPAGAPLRVRANDREALVRIPAGGALVYGRLTFVSPGRRPRALGHAVQQGLFDSEFGRGYYSGFIDNAPDFLPVYFSGESRPTDAGPSASAPTKRFGRGPAAIAALGMSRSYGGGLGPSQGIRLGMRASGGGPLVSFDGLRAHEGSVTEWQALLSAGWTWSTRAADSRAWVGASGGGGLVVQATEHSDNFSSAIVVAGPLLGASLDVTPHVSLWMEAQLLGTAYRMEGGTKASLAPSVWLGAALAP